MTVQNVTPIQSFVADGVSKTFILTEFIVDKKEHLEVYVNDIKISHYEYLYNKLTKSVSFYNAPTLNSEIKIKRDITLERSEDYNTFSNGFRPETVDYDFDQLWKVLQDKKVENGELLAALIQVLDNMSDADRKILGELIEQTSKDIEQDTSIAGVLQSEVAKRVGDDAANDFMLQIQQGELYEQLLDYINNILSIEQPNLVNGITSRMVWDNKMDLTQEQINEKVQDQIENIDSVNTEQDAINLAQAQKNDELDNKNISQDVLIADRYTKAETINLVEIEKQRAISEETILDNKINAIGTGNKAYKTYAEMEADKANIPAKSKVTVTNDPDVSKNGDYQYDGTVFTKSIFDPVTVVKDWSNSNPLFNPKPLKAGDNIDTLNTGIYFITADSLAGQLLGTLPPMSQPRRGTLIVYKEGIVWYQTWIRDYSATNETWTRTGNGTIPTEWYDWKISNAEDVIKNSPLLNAKRLESNTDLNKLHNGYFYSTSTSLDIKNIPFDITSPPLFFLYSFSTHGTSYRYQKLTRYNIVGTEIESWERLGNGANENSENFAWNDWIRLLTETKVNEIVDKKINDISLPTINIFPNINLTSDKSYYYQATHTVEDRFDVLLLNEGDGLTYAYYEQKVDGVNYNVGDKIKWSSEIFASANKGGDLSIQFRNNSTLISTTTSKYNSITNDWQLIYNEATIPENCNIIHFRYIRRTGLVKFRKAIVQTDDWKLSNIIPSQESSVVPSNNSFNIFVSKTGKDTNDGSLNNPFVTVQKAIDYIGDNDGTITILDSNWYREQLNISSRGTITLQSAKGQRANLVFSEQLALTKTANKTKVYQAPLSSKPIGMGGARGKALIAEWGTQSSLILDKHIHPVQRGYKYRLPYTEMLEVDSIDKVDSTNGVWYWENGIIYLSATDGSDATLKQYEARKFNGLTHTNGNLIMRRVTLLFSNSLGFNSLGQSVLREDCFVYGSMHNGWGDYAQSTLSYRDSSLGNGNDGFNGTVTSYTSENMDTSIGATYFDPYGALNGDDGISFHIRGTCNIYGGLFEFNTKAGVVHVTGGGGICTNTIARGQTNGFYVATPAPDERNKSSMVCTNTISEDNTYNYRAADNSVMHCNNAVSLNVAGGGAGFYTSSTSTIYTNDCKHEGGTAKVGNVIVKNIPNLT